MKKVLILANHFITIYAFRKELVEKLIRNGNEVYLALPNSEENVFFSKMGCKIVSTPIDRRGTNPISDIKLLFQYVKVIKNVKPDIILTYTIKPNTYGGIAARKCGIKTLHTVTGLGSVYIQNMWQNKIAILLNKIAFKSASRVFFLNEDNKDFYKKKNIIKVDQSTLVVPGSGVNLDNFKHEKLPNNEKIVFTFVGRVLQDKGIEEYLLAAEEIKEIYNNVDFEVVGFVDDQKYIALLDIYEKKGIVKYLGKRDDIPQIMAKSSCIVLPSYGEGRGTVLQEGAAIGRPLITCDTYGCKENVDDGHNGFLCEVANAGSLRKSLEKFIKLSQKEKELMGNKSREKAEKEFDRKKIVNTYITQMNNIFESRS